mgnify:CR=1 FL=1|tara:strand:- start:13625 stop:13846 length:222 start_codon:yes stop_codon:yes gene_type:complete
MSIVKVEVKIDNEGDAAYLINAAYYPYGEAIHDYDTAEWFANGNGSAYNYQAAKESGLTNAPIIHTYEIEVES